MYEQTCSSQALTGIQERLQQCYSMVGAAAAKESALGTRTLPQRRESGAGATDMRPATPAARPGHAPAAHPTLALLAEVKLTIGTAAAQLRVPRALVAKHRPLLLAAGLQAGAATVGRRRLFVPVPPPLRMAGRLALAGRGGGLLAGKLLDQAVDGPDTNQRMLPVSSTAACGARLVVGVLVLPPSQNACLAESVAARHDGHTLLVGRATDCTLRCFASHGCSSLVQQLLQLHDSWLHVSMSQA